MTVTSFRGEAEINATPEEVRRVVLDFSKYPEWEHSPLNTLRTVPPGKDAAKLVPGDKINIMFLGTAVEPEIISNTSDEFSWEGSALAGAFGGARYFQFSPSKTTPGATTFAHGGSYEGWMTWLYEDWPLGLARGKVIETIDGFVLDVKKRVEELKEGNAL